MMCQCTFISDNTCTIRYGTADNGGGYARCGAEGACGKSLYFYLNFAVNLKLL